MYCILINIILIMMYNVKHFAHIWKGAISCLIYYYYVSIVCLTTVSPTIICKNAEDIKKGPYIFKKEQTLNFTPLARYSFKNNGCSENAGGHALAPCYLSSIVY